MTDIDRRGALRSIVGGVVAAGLGAGVLAERAAALPLALQKDLGATPDDLKPELHTGASRPPRRPLPPPHRPTHRRRWDCWWHRGRRHCGWRWR